MKQKPKYSIDKLVAWGKPNLYFHLMDENNCSFYAIQINNSPFKDIVGDISWVIVKITGNDYATRGLYLWEIKNYRSLYDNLNAYGRNFMDYQELVDNFDQYEKAIKYGKFEKYLILI